MANDEGTVEDPLTQPLPGNVGEVHRDAARLLLFWNGGSVDRWIARGERVTIGRSAECDISVDDASVSREHAAVTLGERLQIEDRTSRNGIRVRGTVVAPGVVVPLEAGDVVEMGSAVLVIQRTPLPAAAASTGSRLPEGSSAGPVVGAGAGVGPMAGAERLLAAAARSDIGVLLLGETGVGKSIAAESIHARSARAQARFVRVDCASLPDSLLESELFGHEKGAFTGATQTKPGLIETADKGTVFLDEIGEVPLTTQAKLLSVLETRQVLRIGSLRPRDIDVRFIAATNRDLASAVGSGAFRRDLFFRLRGLPITIPPLRARCSEIPALAARFLDEAVRRSPQGRTVRLSSAATKLLTDYEWSGNLRELRQAMDSAALLCEGEEVQPEHILLDGRAQELATAHPTHPPPTAVPLREQVERLERQRVIEALEVCGGNQTRAAQMLGISRRALILRIEAYGMTRPRKGR
jgi:two-component system response regulator AtoC